MRSGPRTLRALLLGCIAASLFISSSSLASAGLSAASVTDAFGVNVHFVRPPAGTLERIASAGVHWLRTDLWWRQTERKPGEYDFGDYDELVTEAAGHGLRVLFTLDYDNPIYGDGPPASDAAQIAFARWAAAAARHFAGRGVVWELYNEPNMAQFWRPRPDVGAYVRLGQRVAAAMQAAAPDALVIGPASARIDFDFLLGCFRGGLLDHWAAVSVHPYRDSQPESVVDEMKRLRSWIFHYSSTPIPIVVSEWGYASGFHGVDERKQAALLAREWLIDASEGIPISIWYDWSDDGNDPRNPEHHYGAMSRDGVTPKLAYAAAKTISGVLKGARFSRRIPLPRADDWLLELIGPSSRILAIWTTGAEHDVSLPHAFGPASIIDTAGTRRDVASVSTIRATSSPQYVVQKGINVR